jgi:antibiotic biosynthesis monooxygenase (ABM) superfamily enzyme
VSREPVTVVITRRVKPGRERDYEAWLVLVIGGGVNAAFDALPFATPYPVRLLVTIALEVVLMTGGLMPLLTRRLAFWIYPRPRARGG